MKVPTMTFYFTVHPSDLTVKRLVPRASVMLVASSCWKNGRLAVRRPPPGHLHSVCLDSGGFTAARRWGEYPWTVRQYAEWARQTAGDYPLDFVAVMDYACERGVSREVYATNAQRIAATVESAARCLEEPGLPWLPVVQGWTPQEYAACVDLYRRRGVALDYAGLGTMCGRKASDAVGVLLGLRADFPGTRYHVFGMGLRVLADDGAASVVRSWDSYAWNWGTGSKGDACRIQRDPGESWSAYCRRLGEDYLRRVRLMTERARCVPLF